MAQPTLIGDLCFKLKYQRQPGLVVNHVLLEEAKSLWVQYFGGCVPSYSFLQKVLGLCEAGDVAPWWVFGFARDHKVRYPVRFVMFILTSKDRPWPDQGGTSYGKWKCDTISG